MASTLEARVAQHDREIAAIRKLILAGMKMIAKHDENFRLIEAEHLAFRKEMRLLAAQQRETSKTLDRFIRSMERGRNGHS